MRKLTNLEHPLSGAPGPRETRLAPRLAQLDPESPGTSVELLAREAEKLAQSASVAAEPREMREQVTSLNLVLELTE